MARPTSDESADAEASGTDHLAVEGDCIESIANAHGFLWETIWNHPRNAQLKQERADPFVILPGDRVHVPALRPRHESADTEQKHTFRRKGVPSLFQVQVLAGDEPRSDEPYLLVIDDRTWEGRTDAEGWVKVRIPPAASRGELTVGEGAEAEVYPLELGGMDPVEVLAGLQKRLANLGYDCSVTGELDDETRAAIAEFQELQELEVTGEPDDATRGRLRDVHGS